MREKENGWLTPLQAARRLGIRRRELYRLLDQGTLPGYRFGSVIRVRAADVEAYLAQRGGEAR